MLEYFLSPAKADLLPTDGGSSARSDPPGYGSATANARNLGFIFDSNLTFSHQISAVSRACFYQIVIKIRDLRRIRSVLDFSTAHTIGTAFVLARLDYYIVLFPSKNPANSPPAHPELSCP